MKNKRIIIWVILAIFAILVALIYQSALIRIALMYGIKILFALFVSCLFYAFAGIFTKKRGLKYIITVCLLCVVMFVRYEVRQPHVVQMEEDVIYILPDKK
jgi:O-antigen ligase